MKKGIKNLLVLSFIIFLLSSYQDRTCICSRKNLDKPVVLEDSPANDNAAFADYDLALMPIGNFILVQ
jgi:hypothetical protein